MASKKEKETTEVSKLSPEVMALCDTLQEKIHWNEDEKAIVFDDDAFEKTLPEGLTKEHVDKTITHLANLGAAVTKVFGDKAIEVMKENKDIDKLSTNFNFDGMNRYFVSLRRTVEHTKPGTTEKVEVKGRVSTILKIDKFSPKSPTMETVQQLLTEAAEANEL